MTMKCIRKNCPNEAMTHPTFGILPCQSCQDADDHPRFGRGDEAHPISRLHRIQAQRDRHIGDMLQPFFGRKVNPDFFKRYPYKIKDYGVAEELKRV